MALDWLKRRKERESQRAALAHRIPAGQELTDKWPVLHYGDVPKFKPEAWDFSISGLVARPQRYTYEQFNALPRVTETYDIHCVTGWSKLDNTWEGVRVRDLVEAAGPLPTATFVMVHGENDYTTNVPLDLLLEEGSLIANQHNGQDIEPAHGWPYRLVLPRLYFWKSAKWVRSFELMDTNERGFWERYGYHNNGDPWKEERYSWQEG
ncbi:MAG: sulfite oxidase-like oxidoreductase [Dehalococcoidia bacterium]|nr:sulfite oxidase-like oxidoreductase [Dehalococcoidia bacterium]